MPDLHEGIGLEEGHHLFAHRLEESRIAEHLGDIDGDSAQQGFEQAAVAQQLRLGFRKRVELRFGQPVGQPALDRCLGILPEVVAVDLLYALQQQADFEVFHVRSISWHWPHACW